MGTFILQEDCFVNVGICFTIGSEVMVLKGSTMMAILSNYVFCKLLILLNY